MARIVGVGLAVVRQDSEVARFRNAEPGSLLFTLQISGGEDILVVGVPPVRSARGTQDELVAVIDDDEGVGRVCRGYENDTHGFGSFWRSSEDLDWIIFRNLSLLYSIVIRYQK